MALIELRNVEKTYVMGDNVVRALDGVTLDIERGEFVALIGPSGSGKSTLMNILGCLDRPTSGSYRLNGQEVAGLTAAQRADLRNRELGFVFQNFNLLSRTTALDNVELPLMYGPRRSRRERHQRAHELLDLVGLGDRVDHHPSQLSGGQQQRVAIARALSTGPSILMGDEPTGNLDSRTSADIIKLFKRLNADQHLTVILVTHDLEVAHNARRNIVMRDGRIICDTTDANEAAVALKTTAVDAVAE
jgi:ABC-type lipoprotein export system ATPase subunit